MKESFEYNGERIPVAKKEEHIAQNLDDFKEKLGGWMTGPEGADYCPSCWAAERINPPLFSEKGKQAVRPTVEIIDHRKGVDGWYVACQNNKCNRAVFLSFEQATASRSPKKKKRRHGRRRRS